MNRTVNINLANILFHIDEKAFNKLQRYLEAIKRSFAGTAGSDEIIADIEARIAELFQDRLESERQVITLKEVDEVITIMGQPEDYMVDEDIFEDTPPSARESRKRAKKLYRDLESKYIGGVCSGLGYYFGIDALWIRLFFIFFAIFTGFGFIAYILLWILVPEAATTSQKLDMKGEPINISNIERTVKEGIDDVTERVKNVDYQKMGDKVKSGGQTFFDTLGDIIMFLFKVIGKFIGILLIIIGAATLIGLFIALFTVGILDIIHIPGIDFYDMVSTTGTPVWLVSLLAFFAIGIPFFFLLYLGLKILVNNLKSIGNVAKFSLLGLWLLSIIGLSVLGIKQASAQAYTGTVTEKEDVFFAQETDTIRISMRSSDLYDNQENIGIHDMFIAYTDDGERVLYSDDVRFDIKMSQDSLKRIRIRKDADGSSFGDARNRASQINYSYALESNTLFLDEYLTTDTENKARDQEVRITFFVPAGKVIQFDESTRRHIGRTTRYDKDLYRSDIVDYYWTMAEDGELKCHDCPEEIEEPEIRDKENRIIINEDGIDMNIRDDEDSFEMKIDEDGLKIKTDDNNR